MPKDKSPLTDAQRASAEALRRIWDSKKKELGLSQETAGAHIGFSQSTMSQYLNGDIPLNVEASLKFGALLQVDVAEFDQHAARLAANAYAVHAATTGLIVRDTLKSTYAANGDLAIPHLSVRASMGRGLLPPEHVEVVTRISLRVSELRRQVRGPISSPNNLRFITGFGDSMKPTYQDGDVLLVDTGVTEVKIDAVYVLELGDDHELYIKTLQRVPGSRAIKMISDNRKYDPHVINDPEKEGMVIRGRVLLVWNAKPI